MANVTIKTPHGYLSLQPDGRLEFRETPGPWETFTIEGLSPVIPPAPAPHPIPVPAPGPGPTPTPAPVPFGADAIDLSRAKVAARDCPDVRSWPIVAAMQSVTFAPGESYERGDTMVEFVGRDALPAANSTQGPIAYTLWIGCNIAGNWHLLPIVECIRGYVPTGRLLQPGQVSTNLLYYGEPPMLGYQPAPGEPIALFCTTGDTRRQNAQAVSLPGRTNAVLVPFRVGTFRF